MSIPSDRNIALKEIKNKNAYWRLLGYPRKAWGKVMFCFSFTQIILKVAFRLWEI